MPTERIPRYELEHPDTSLVLNSLARYVDDPEAAELWQLACEGAGLTPDATHAPDDLLKAIDRLERLSDLAATCAKGLRIRVRSYMVLANANPAT